MTASKFHEENRLLREQLERQRVRFTDDLHVRLAAKAKKASKASATDQQQIVDTAKKVADVLQANGAEAIHEPEEMHHS